MKPYQHNIKRLMDVLLSLLALVLFFPLLLFLFLLIKLDSKGPALFRETRVGKDGGLFTCYKFRTMYVDAPDIRNADGSTFNAEDDPRVTRVGRFLRKTTLDELPQFINALKGDMSIVGPRPDLPDQLPLDSGRHKKRLLVKPGMTGWAWIHGRNSVPVELRRELDVEYVENYSLWLDLRILFRTIPMVLLAKGRARVIDFIKKHQLTNLVYLGKLEPKELIKIYGICDIGLCAYGPESNVGMPDKAYDYMAAGLPIVNSLQGELEDFLRTHEIGTQYVAGYPDSLAAVLEGFAKSEERRRVMARNSYDAAMRFDRNVQYQKFVDLVEGIFLDRETTPRDTLKLNLPIGMGG